MTSPLVVNICVYDLVDIDDLHTLHNLKSSGQLEKNIRASIVVRRWFMEPGAKRIPLTVKEHGIHGTIFVPPGKGPFPGEKF